LSYSIVVVSWECAEQVRALVESMNAHLTGERPELVVADNHSSDDPEAEANEWSGETRFLQIGFNAGFGAATNAGVEIAAHEGVVMLNPDTRLLDAGLGSIAREAVDRNELVGPRLLNEDGSPQPSASGPPVGPWPWVGALVPGALAPTPIRARTEPWRLDRATEVAWLTGACVAGPRDALLSLGPFDPDIHLFAEDMDLGLRAAREGIRSRFCPELCSVVHLGGASTAVALPEGTQRTIAENRRAVIRDVYGERRERAASRALRLNLRLRVIVKGLLRRDAERERAELDATRAAIAAAEPPERG